LGHETFNKVKRTNNPYAFQKERRELLAAWANYLITGAKPNKVEASGVVDVPFEEVQPRRLSGPKSATGPGPDKRLPEALEFARDCYLGLLYVVTNPKAPAAILSMLQRGPSAYTPMFREKGPPASEAGRFVAQYVLDQTVLAAYRCFTDPTLSKVERARAVQETIKDILAEIYVKNSDENATTLANAAVDAALTRWPLREKKKAGSNLEPIPGSEAPEKTAA
jgi:hypothetical protein